MYRKIMQSYTRLFGLWIVFAGVVGWVIDGILKNYYTELQNYGLRKSR